LVLGIKLYGVIEACGVGLRGARLKRLLALMALLLVGSPIYLAWTILNQL